MGSHFVYTNKKVRPTRESQSDFHRLTKFRTLLHPLFFSLTDYVLCKVWQRKETATTGTSEEGYVRGFSWPIDLHKGLYSDRHCQGKSHILKVRATMVYHNIRAVGSRRWLRMCHVSHYYQLSFHMVNHTPCSLYNKPPMEKA